MTGLYIHVPICISRCRYCDFYKLTPQEWDDIALYLDCLEIELKRLPRGFAPGTVFIGGGTPTALADGDYARLLQAVRRTLDFSRVAEFSTEANPGTLSEGKLAAMADAGINRVSIGVQSFNPAALRLLGRIHDPAQAVAAFRMLRAAGFANLNIDLIQGIPGMKPSDVLADARRVADLGPEHVSSYNLSYEPGTALAIDRAAGRILPPSEDEEADTYYAAKALLVEAGYGHYEISNFAREGRRCLHNLLYWQGGEYLGCGPSAHSHWRGRRFGNLRNLSGWCERLRAGRDPFDESERLPPEQKARETLVMGLRLVEGVELDRFREATGYEVEALCAEVLPGLLDSGLLRRLGNRLALAPDALFISNSVFSELV